MTQVPDAPRVTAKRQLPAIVAAFVVLVSAAIVAMGVLREWSARDSELRTAGIETTNLANSILQHAEDSIDLVDNAIIGVAHRLELEGQTPEAIRRMQSFLHLRKATLPRLRGLFVYDANGDWLATSEALDFSGLNNSDRPYFIHHRLSRDSGVFIGPPVRSRSGGQWIMTVSRRISGPDGRFSGVVLATMDVSYFANVYAQFSVGSKGTLALIRSNGTLMTRMPFDEDLIGRDVANSPILGHARQAPSGSLSFTSGLDGVERISAYRTSERFPLIAVASKARDEVLADWRHGALERMSFVGTLALAIAGLGFVLVRQVVERQKMTQVVAAREADFRLLAEASSDMVTRIDRDGRLIYVSPSAARVIGWSAAELTGRPALAGVKPEDRPAVDARVEALRRGEIAEAKLVYRTRHRLRGEIWIEASLNVTRDPTTGEADGVVAVSRDMTEHKELESQLASLAARDGLTGIANRRRFDEALTLEWARCQRAGAPLSLLLIDVDHFKAFNDGYGHQSGDECLRRVAGALANLPRRPADLVARYGGEEFAVLLPETDPAGCAHMGERVRQAVQALGLAHRGNPPGEVVTVSVGAATTHPGCDQPDPGALIEAADGALYAAKAAGRNTVRRAPAGFGPSAETRRRA